MRTKPQAFYQDQHSNSRQGWNSVPGGSEQAGLSPQEETRPEAGAGRPQAKLRDKSQREFRAVLLPDPQLTASLGARRWQRSERRSRRSPARPRRVRRRGASRARPAAARAPAPPGPALRPLLPAAGHHGSQRGASFRRQKRPHRARSPRPVLSLPGLSRPRDTPKQAAVSLPRTTTPSILGGAAAAPRQVSHSRVQRSLVGGVAPPSCALSLVRSAFL